MNETRTLGIRQHKSFSPKTCTKCGESITKGVFYTKTVAIVDGKFTSKSWHKECQENHAGYVKDREREE